MPSPGDLGVGTGVNPGVSINYTVSQSLTTSPAPNTSNDGWSLIDATPASAGNQQYSPRLHFTGQGWATTPVASQVVDWIIEAVPIQGAANPTSGLNISSSINGSAYTLNAQFGSGANGVFNVFGSVTASAMRVTGATVPTNGIYMSTANWLGFASNGVFRGSFDVNGNYTTNFGHGDLSKSVQVPTTGFTITVANNTSTLLLNPAGTLATGTVTMPAAPFDGQEVRFSSTQIVTTLTVSPNASQTISNAPSTIAAGQGYAWIYHLATTNWFRLY